MTTFAPSDSAAADETVDRSSVSGHYAHSGLIQAIENGITRMGKTTDTVTVDDLASVDEFHIGGRKATDDLMGRLAIEPGDHVLDVGCGLGGPARFVADRYKCRVSGIDLTFDYVETGNRLCEWVGLSDRVKLFQSTALSISFQVWIVQRGVHAACRYEHRRQGRPLPGGRSRSAAWIRVCCL